MSLFVSLEIVKVVQGFLMEHDDNMCFGDGELDEIGMKGFFFLFLFSIIFFTFLNIIILKSTIIKKLIQKNN